MTVDDISTGSSLSMLGQQDSILARSDQVVHSSALGLGSARVAQGSVCDPMDFALEVAPHFEVVSPITSITFVEDRADPSPTQSPAPSFI